ncbi:hypothetical protein AB0N12_14410 [Streptomyces albogriseolus]|uniref:hypothetical protein n=1 Tax=Streptomyces albogriseolus TaxID=1887 RepID=UPI00345FEC93
MTWSPSRPVSRTVTGLTRYLLDYVEWSCHQMWAADFAEELEGLTKTLRRVSGIEPVKVLLPVTCPTCDLRTMVREESSGWAAEYRYCPAVKLSTREYSQLVSAQAQAVSTPTEV